MTRLRTINHFPGARQSNSVTRLSQEQLALGFTIAGLGRWLILVHREASSTDRQYAGGLINNTKGPVTRNLEK